MLLTSHCAALALATFSLSALYTLGVAVWYSRYLAGIASWSWQSVNARNLSCLRLPFAGRSWAVRCASSQTKTPTDFLARDRASETSWADW